MFIVSMALIVGGYVLLYYGYSMYQAYKGQGAAYVTTAQGGGVPMSFLLGLTKVPDATKPGSKPPFSLGGNTGSAQPSSNTTGTGTTGSGVQAV